MRKSVIAVTAGLAAVADAFWRMECQGRVGLARMDPVVYPGEDSPHMHAIHGSSGECGFFFFFFFFFFSLTCWAGLRLLGATACAVYQCHSI
jgi:hypothetical protein